MTDMLTEALAAAAPRWPSAARVVEQMNAMSARFLMGQVRLLVSTRGDAFWAEAERLVGLSEALGGSPVEALLDYTVAYLKEQARFTQTQEYSNTDFDAVLRDVYDNPEVMEKFYLHGLLLTHAFWPIHFDIHEFFRKELLPRVPDEGVGAELGYGHGLYLLEVLSTHPGTSTVSYDISRFSQDFAGRLLRHAGIAPSRFDLRLGDVRERLPFADASLDWAVFAEVLEHIPDPAGALREIARCLKPGRPLFATTVVDSNAIDHLYQFKDVPEIHAMLRECGFDIQADRTLRVKDYDEKTRDPTIDVALVCTPRGR